MKWKTSKGYGTIFSKEITCIMKKIMNCIHIVPYSPYNEKEILKLYQSVGWSNYYENPKLLRESFANSLCILGAYNENILVLSEYQHQKVGTKLLTAILNQYRTVYQKILTTDNTEKTAKFYKSLGFIDLVETGCIAFQHFTK